MILSRYYRVGKLIWADAGGSLLVYLFDGEKPVFVGFTNPRSMAQLLRKQVLQVDICVYAATTMAQRAEIPADLLELDNAENAGEQQN